MILFGNYTVLASVVSKIGFPDPAHGWDYILQALLGEQAVDERRELKVGPSLLTLAEKLEINLRIRSLLHDGQ